MGVYKNPLDLYKAQKARFDRLNRSLKAMHREVASLGLDDALQLVSGPPAAKGSMARSGGLKRGRGALLPVGRRTGRLKHGMRLRRVSGGVQSFAVGSSAPHGRFVLHPAGTRFTVGRGFFAETKKRWRARNKALLDSMKQRIRN